MEYEDPATLSGPAATPIVDSAPTETISDQYGHVEQIFYKLGYEYFEKDGLFPDVCLIFNAAAPGEDEHNCLGCTLKDLLRDTHTQLESANQYPEKYIDDRYRPLAFRQFVSILNTFWEVSIDAFKLIKLDQSYYENLSLFYGFHQVRGWANFFKHPNIFAYTIHHPTFTYEESDSNTTLNRVRIHANSDPSETFLSTEEILRYWRKSGVDNQSKDLKNHFGEARTATVVLPNMRTFTDQIVQDIREIVSVLTTGIFAQTLKKVSTVSGYFMLVEEDDE